MAFSVNTNVGAMVALQGFMAARAQLDGVSAQISTGLRVTGPVDDAADFAIAQGVRSNIAAWSTIATTLGGAQGLLGVTLAAATQISNLLGTLKKQTIEYFSATDPSQQTVLQNAVNQTLANIDLAATSATYNGADLITTTDTAQAPPAPPPDQGQTFSLTGGTSHTHALGTTAGQLILNFTRTGGGGGSATLQLVYNGGVVASATVSRANPSGSLIFNYPASPSTDITVQLNGGGGRSATYSFVLNFPPTSTTAPGGFQVISDIQGNNISVQHRSMLTADLGFTAGFLSGNLDGALAQIDDAQQLVDANLGYYGAAATQIKSALDSAQRFQDALTQGLGSLVDANLAQDSAALQAAKVRQSLSLSALSIANRAPQILLGLFRH